MLKENGLVFESNVGKSPFKFQLGTISNIPRVQGRLHLDCLVRLSLTIALVQVMKNISMDGMLALKVFTLKPILLILLCLCVYGRAPVSSFLRSKCCVGIWIFSGMRVGDKRRLTIPPSMG